MYAPPPSDYWLERKTMSNRLIKHTTYEMLGDDQMLRLKKLLRLQIVLCLVMALQFCRDIFPDELTRQTKTQEIMYTVVRQFFVKMWAAVNLLYMW